MSNVGNIYNNFFTGVFMHKEVAVGFLKTFGPPEIVKTIDMASLEVQDGTFVDIKNRLTRSDILYKAKIGGIDSYLYMLFEHKSSPDKYVARQLLGYMNGIWSFATSKSNDEELKIALLPILPIVVYHGEEIWNVPIKLSGILKGYDLISKVQKEMVPDFEYLLIDIVRDMKEIFDDVALKVVVKTLQYSHGDELECTEVLIEITAMAGVAMREGAQPHLLDVFVKSFNFFIRFKRIDMVRYTRECEDLLPDEGRNIIMTTAEELRKEGREEALKESAKKAINKGIDLEIVAEIVELPLDELIAIKKEMFGVSGGSQT